MEETILLGLPVFCTDGEAGAVSGLALNPDTGALEFLVVTPAEPGPDHLVPRSQVAGVGDAVALVLRIADVRALATFDPQDPAGGNLAGLSVVTAVTPVLARDGSELGRFRGAVVSSERRVEHIMVRTAGGDVVETYQFDRAGDQALTVVPL